MLYLKNDTPFVSEMFVLASPRGIDTLSVFVKATFDLLANAAGIAAKQQPLITQDTYRGEPGESSLKYPLEVHPEKPGTDVIVAGEACAPEGRMVTELNVGLSVAGRVRVLKVFGDRAWDGGLIFARPGKPKPFNRMPLIYERAFGGTQKTGAPADETQCEARNPVGKGFSGKSGERDLIKIGVPNIEDPQNLMKGLSGKPRPAGWGAIAPHWQPRASFAGTCDEKWQKTRAPFLPEDCDPRYFHAASPDLIFSDYLKGGEPVIIVNMSPQGKQTFRLPACEPKIEVNITGRFDTATPRLETVFLEPTDERISLTWRASATSGKKITDARVEVTL